ncbi:unnamed protein product [Microthlaspi erraticum]|uniref:Uncharacterized protein n=1 Tax=Microthlaspi erraticum TaxID=1685480 RepID=A0A6D2L837_9BRAS|nr:unnamed protein product [Microthlaspi erraticum]
MTWSSLFKGIRGSWFVYVDVENGDVVTIQADAPSVSMDTDDSAPFQPTQPADTAQNFGPENVQQPPLSSSGIPQEKFASSSQSDLDVLVNSVATSHENGDKVFDKDDVTVDADEGKSVESTKERKKKSKRANTICEVSSGAEIVEPVKVAETVCKDLESKVEDSAAEFRLLKPGRIPLC